MLLRMFTLTGTNGLLSEFFEKFILKHFCIKNLLLINEGFLIVNNHDTHFNTSELIILNVRIIY